MEILILYTLIMILLFGVIANFMNIVNPNSTAKKAILLGRPILSDRTVIVIGTIFMFIYFSLFGYLVTLL